MALATTIVLLALIEYMIFGGFVGWARGKYGVKAPATTGHPVFERYFRVQMNTLENLVIFIPGMYAFAYYVHVNLAALLGLVFIIGRILYFQGYVKEPKARHRGSMISSIAMVILVLGGLIGALIASVKIL